MIEPWLEVLRPRVRGERALDAVREIARHHRIQASPGYDDAARWLAGTLADEGFDVRIEEVAADGRSAYLGCVMPEGWSVRTATADLVAAGTRERIADFASEPLSLVQRSAPARGTYPLVALADGTEREHYEGVDVRGRVVLTEGAVQRVHQLAVVERGAAGLLAYGRRLVPPTLRSARSSADGVVRLHYLVERGATRPRRTAGRGSRPAGTRRRRTRSTPPSPTD